MTHWYIINFFFFIRGLLFTITYFIFVLFFIFFSQFAYLNSGFINGIINTNFTFIFRFSEAGIYFFLYSIVIYIWYIGSSSEEEVIKYNDYNYILNDIYDKKKNFFGNITTSVGEDGYSENEIESKYEQLLGLSLFFWMMVFSNMYLMDSGDLHKVTPGFLDGLFQFNMENDQFWFKDLFAKIFGKIPYKVSEKKKLFILRPLDYEYLLMYSEQWLGYLQFHKIVYHYDKYPRMMHEEIGQNYPPTFTLAYKLYAKVQYVNHILYEKWRSNVSNIIYYDSEIFKDWKRGKAPKYFLRNSGLVFDYAGKMPARLMDNEIYIVDVYPTDSIRNNLQRACYKWIYSNHNIDLDSKYARYLRLYNYKIHWVKDIRHIPVKGAYVIGSNEDVFSAVIAEREFSQRERALVIFPRFLKKSAQETILRLYRTIWFWQPMFDHIGYFIKRKFPGQFSYLLSVFYHILGNPEQSEFYLTRSKYEYKGEMESRLASIENFLYFQDKNFTELFLNIICSRQFVFETLKAVRFNNVMRTFPDYLTTYVPPGLIGNYSNSASRYLLMIDRLNLELLHGCRGKDLSEFAHIPSYFDIRKDHDLFLELANRLGRHCSVDEFRIAKSLGYATIRGSFGLCNVSPRAAWRTLEVFYGLIYTKHYQIIEKYAIDQLMDAVAHIGLEDTEEAKRLRYAVYVLYRVDYRPLSGEYDYWKLYHIWDTEDTEYRDYEWHYDEWSYGAEPDELRIILLDWYGPIDLDLYLD